jgi:hypothetical protein
MNPQLRSKPIEALEAIGQRELSDNDSLIL